MSNKAAAARLLALLESAERPEERARAYRELRMFLEDQAEIGAPARSEERATELKLRYESLRTPNEFKPGQIVKWKVNLKNRRRPQYGEPAIVVEVLQKPVFAEEAEAATPYFREPLDLILGILDTDNDFLCFHFDKRRFEAF